MFLFFGCAAGHHNAVDNENTQLVVHYNGKEVHRRGGIYSGEQVIADKIENKEEIIVIFSAEWCKSCKTTQNIVKKINLKTKIHYLNFDELWVKKIAYLMQVKTLPYMVHSKDKGKIENHKIGTGKIIDYLLNLERK